MKRNFAAAFAYDMNSLEDAVSFTPARAVVRGRDGLMRAVDIARLVWPDDTATAGVDCMADLSRVGPRGRC